jgi:zeta-carotene desaturase
MNASALVIGAGFAGMSAAVYLAQSGVRVTVLEQAPRPGGRAYSFRDKATGDMLDNGQHLLMGCYRETLDFLKILGTRDALEQLPARAVWISPGGKKYSYDPGAGDSRAGALPGLMKLGSIGWWDKLMLIRALGKMERLPEDGIAGLNAISCAEWLHDLKQPPRVVDRFWKPLLVSALNEEPDRASADGLAVVVKNALLGNSQARRFLVPGDSLSGLFEGAFDDFLRNRGGEVVYRSRVERLNIEQGMAYGGDRDYGGDVIISAVPPHVLSALVPEAMDAFEYSPIVSCYLFLKEKVLEERMAGLLESSWDWVFSKDMDKGKCRQRLCLVRSAAREFAAMDREALVENAIRTLEDFIPGFSREMVIHSQVIKEKRATVSLEPGSNEKRPASDALGGRLFLAGDWTATGYPATIESAVLSGRLAAQAVGYKE